jgi:hypothetical protein
MSWLWGEWIVTTTGFGSTLNAGPEAARQARLVVVVGNPDFQHGRTRLELDATGSVRVSNQQGDQERVLEGSLAAEDVEGTLRSIPAVFAGLDEKRLGVPDEARYRFELVMNERPMETTVVWESQLEDSKDGRSLLESLRRIVADISERTIVL